MNIEISPPATEAEVAAIVAAIEVLWPRPVVPEVTEPVRRPTWRFSNRWWVKPLPSRRQRPRSSGPITSW